MKWFKHDANACIDAKIRKLIMRHGIEGYGLYFYCLEAIARTVEKHNLTFELEHDAEVIGFEINMHKDKVEELMRYMIELDLFENDRGIITCLKMAKRTDEYTEKLLKKSTKTDRVRQCPDNVPTMSRQCPDSVGTKSVLIEEKRIDRKEEREKNSESDRFAPPSLDEIKAYATNRNLNCNPEKFFDYYSAAGWKVRGELIESWKSQLRLWSRRADEKGVDERPRQATNDSHWSKTATGIRQKGQELNLDEKDFESFPYFKEAVIKASNKR